MPFLLAEILNFQGSTHRYGMGSLSYNILLCIFPRPSFRFLVWILFLEIGQYTHSI